MSKILLIEDSSFQRNILNGILSRNGFDVIEAVDGEKGYESIKENSPDCIIMDLLMPVKNGFQLLELMKQENITIPVIILTANIQEPVKQKCMDLGVSVFLNKPPNIEEIIKSLNNILSN